MRSPRLVPLDVGLFFLDENVAEPLGHHLDSLGHDILSARAAGMKGASDFRQLLYCARSTRTMVTYDVKDFELLHETWMVLAREWQVDRMVIHHGILIIPPPSRLSNSSASVEIDTLERIGPLADRLVAWKPSEGWREGTVTFDLTPPPGAPG